MIKNILLAASLVVILTLSLMCVHFYNIARSARQEAIMQRLLLEQEMARAQSMSSFLQQLLVSADLRPTVRPTAGELQVIPYLEVANAYVGRTAITPNLEMQLRAATQATQEAQAE